MQRLSNLSQQLQQNKTAGKPLRFPKTPNDVVICYAQRTPLTKQNKEFKNCSPEFLLQQLMIDLQKRTKVNPKDIQDIMIGNVLQTGAGMYPIRFAQFLAGFPDTVPVVSVNRLCSSGLESCAIVAAKIKNNIFDMALAGGVENMSMYDMNSLIDPEKINEQVFDNENARNSLLGMGVTSENVAAKYNLTRKEQDEFAVLSQQKAANAQKNGLYTSEIVPIKVIQKDKDGNEKEIIVSKDGGIRNTSVEALAKLKPSFKKDGSTTAGNSSQLTDGAALVLLARRSTAERLGLPILAQFITHAYSVVGVPPEIMGVGPGYAIPECLKKAGLTKDDIDIYEVNEAFASQALWSCKHLNLDPKKVNPKGGAIALGHPLGCTGARQICTLLPELKRTGGRLGIVSMCIGTGMGAAGLIQSEQ